MKRIILLFLLAIFRLEAALNIGDPFYVASLSVTSLSVSNFSPTNFGPVVGWWPGDSVTPLGTTNGVRTWSDLSGLGHDLTNYFPTNVPTALTNSLNGHTTVLFNGVDNFLSSASHSNGAATEWWMVMRPKVRGAATDMYYIDATGSVNRIMQYFSGAERWRMFAGASIFVDFSDSYTNRWMVYTWVFDGANSYLRTNNVIVANVNPLSSGMTGLSLGGPWAHNGSFAAVEFAEIAVFDKTNTAAIRSSVYSGFTNKYGNANF